MENERNALWIHTDCGVDVTCVQVAGLIARRILCYVKPKDRLARGQRFGFIRFGSRVDVYLPPAATPKAAVGDKVYAGETILAMLPSNHRPHEPSRAQSRSGSPVPASAVPGSTGFPTRSRPARCSPGFYAIVQAMNLRFELAAQGIFAAMVFDGLDGRVARLTRTQSEFGAEYDRLSDMVSFGAAPALVIYEWSLKGMGKMGWFAAFVYCACAALRLGSLQHQYRRRRQALLPGPAQPGRGRAHRRPGLGHGSLRRRARRCADGWPGL